MAGVADTQLTNIEDGKNWQDPSRVLVSSE